MKLHWSVWLLVVLVLAWATWFYRYDWKLGRAVGSQYERLYRFDRWTGEQKDVGDI